MNKRTNNNANNNEPRPPTKMDKMQTNIGQVESAKSYSRQKMDDLDFDLDELGEFDSMEEDDDSIEPVRGVLRDLLVANPFPVAEEVSAESLLAVVESSNSQSLSQILSERLLSLSVLRKVLFAVCNGPPKAFIAQNIKPRKSVCGKQWMRGEWLYHCKNCEKDPQCAVCVSCFEPELHVGHEFHMSRAAGGCCDCGDEQAWDVKSFCSNHRDRPISEHEKMVFASLVPALNEIGLCLKKTLSGFPDSRDSFVNLMRFFTALPVIFGDGICSSMASVFFGPNLLLRALCEAENSFTEALFRSLLNDLIFAYIVDFSFKMEFSREYTRMYESVLTSVGKKKRSLQDFSVQIFTNALITETLVTENPKFVVDLLSFLTRVVESSRVKDERMFVSVMDGDKVTLSRGAPFRAVNDLRYLLSHSQFVLALFANSELRVCFADLCAAVHGSLWLKKESQMHVEFEPQGYRDVLGFEAHLFDTIMLIEPVLKSSRCSVDTLKKFALLLWSRLKDWMKLHRMAGMAEEYMPVCQGHFMSRVLSIVLRSACLGHFKCKLEDVCPALLTDIDEVEELSLFSARLYRFMSGVESGYWKRNGETAVVYQWYYSSVSCFEYRQNDLFLVRALFSASAQQRGRFEWLLSRWIDVFSGEPSYVEALFRLLLVVMSDSSSMEDDVESMGKQAIAAALAGEKGSLSHSALLKAVPDFLQKSLHFDALLKQVADFSLSSFTLKKSCFSLLCPYWGHWASNQWQNCEELLSEEHRKQNKLAADAPFSVAPFALSENRFGRNAVVAILESDHLRSLCAAVLQSANDKAFGLSVLRVADFLTQVARSCKRVSELSKLADRIANAEQVSIPYVRSALIRFRETMSKRLAKKTEETKATVPEAVAETEAQRKQRMREEAKARQAAIQLKMQQSRAQFAQANEKDLANQAKQEESEQDVESCVLCHEASNKAENPLCSMILLQKFRVVEECSFGDEGMEADRKRLKYLYRGQDEPSLQPDDNDTLEQAVGKFNERFRAKLLCSAPPELSVRSCGHVLHMDCYHRFFARFYGRGGQEARDNGIDAQFGEFVCPLCSSLANTVVPIVKPDFDMSSEAFHPVDLLLYMSRFSSENKRKDASFEEVSLVAMRAGMLLWNLPPPIVHPALLYDAPIAMCLADELTRDEGTRDQMMKQTMLGCEVLANVCSKGDFLTVRLFNVAFNTMACGHLDPLLFFGRMLMSLPARVRRQSVAALFGFSKALCVVKKEDPEVLLSRCTSLMEAVGLTGVSLMLSKADNDYCVQHVLSLAKEVVSSTFHRRLSLTLASLPHCLQDKEWFSSVVSWKCGVCGTTPANVAICLLCSGRVCKNGHCCRREGIGECAQHARVHHGDLALFFDVQDNSVLIARGDVGGCITKSPYLDAFGEDDVGLRRGRPVYLHPPLLEDLRRRFICGTLIDKTINTGMRLLLASWRSF